MKISVIGLGYVGFPLFLTLLKNKKLNLKVVGIEDNSAFGKRKIKEIFQTDKEYFNNKDLDYLFSKHKNRFDISTNYSHALDSDFLFICLPFNINKNLKTNEKKFLNSIRKYYIRLKKGSTIILNSTIPPGFTSNLIRNLKKRKFFRKEVEIVYSPERVEPGLNYYKSIVETPRVFSSNGNKKISNKILNLFNSIFKINKSKLIEFEKYEEAELCKVLENSYRATNIAFIEEWGIFSEKLGANIYSVIDAIKQRETHKNIMRPGLGVGGYCLTKDPFFAKFSSSTYLKTNLKFPFINLTMQVNSKMHSRSIALTKKILSENIVKKILLVGISYTNNVDDLRNSRAIDLLKSIKRKKYNISIYDPYVKEKKILNSKIIGKTNKLQKFDLIIMINNYDVKKIFLNNIKKNSIIIDLNRILEKKDINILKKKIKKIYILGRGDI